MSGVLLTLPDRNIFPAAKWEAYIKSQKRLSELSLLMKRQSALMKRLTRAQKRAEKDVARMRSELLEAVENGAGIEHGGRIARLREKEETGT